jgi:hypothetical protein
VFLLALLLALSSPGRAHAESARCPGVAPQPTDAMPGDAQKVRTLWGRVGDAGFDPSNGPLGCPLPNSAPKAGWAATQQFQRGWILVGHDPKKPEWLVAIHGVHEWWLWWRGGKPPLEAAVRSGGSSTTPPRRTAFSPGFSVPPEPAGAQEIVARLPSDFAVELLTCGPPPCEVPPPSDPSIPSNWKPIVLPLSVPHARQAAATFDLAAALGRVRLTEPSPSDVDARRAAALPGWLPCYVQDPTSDPEHPSRPPDIDGEDAVSFAILMVRRSRPCPITGKAPRAEIDGWLGKAALPSGQLPGTDANDPICGRHGDLDVTLAGLLHIYLGRPGALSTATKAHLRRILAPWGGETRPDPAAYVDPDGTCFGVHILDTENHLLLQESDRYLIDRLLAQTDPAPNYDTTTNGTDDWILRFLRLIVRRDFYEFNALPYQRYALKALWNLHDYASDDPPVQHAAEGALDWAFAKYALSASLLRDIRPFRRRPEAPHYNDGRWFGDATDAPAWEGALLAGGGLQYGVDPANLNDHNADADFTNLADYPELGSLNEDLLAEIADVADTTYRLPPAIASWYAQRFAENNDDGGFLQEIHHAEDPGPYESKLFVQTNDGAELYSGSRSWVIDAGGIDTPPSVPGEPPGTWKATLLAAGVGVAGGALAGALIGGLIGLVFGGVGAIPGAIIGGIVGGVVGAFFGNHTVHETQHDTLWRDQPAILQPTTLIPTGASLERGQTLRFDSPHIAVDAGSVPARMCVAEGFMCGFNLRMPSRPFPDDNCPIKPEVTTFTQPELEDTYHRLVADQDAFGCLTFTPFTWHEWTIYTYERGQIAVATNDPPTTARWVLASVHFDHNDPENRTVHVQWALPGDAHDWYDVHGYSGDDEGGDGNFLIYGDADNTNKFDRGAVDYTLTGADTASQWEIRMEACDPTHFIFIRTGHKCVGGLLPSLHVSVAPEPKQSFSCAAHYEDATQSIGLEVGGNCNGGSYGLYLYILNRGCSFNQECPQDAQSFGFVIAASSRNWSYSQFAAQINEHIHSYEQGHPRGYSLQSPPMDLFVPFDATHAHTIRFQWRLPGRRTWAILADTGPAGGLVSALGTDIEKWPVAAGSSTVSDQLRDPIIVNNGNGCFTVGGTPDTPEPRALVVDLRSNTPPAPRAVPSSAQAQACR